MCQKCAKKAKSDTTGCAKIAEFSTKVTHQSKNVKDERCAKSVPKRPKVAPQDVPKQPILAPK